MLPNKEKIKKLAYLLNEETGFKMADDVAWALAKYTLVKQNYYKGKRCHSCGYIGGKRG